MNWPDGFRASAAADSTASTGSTSKNRPKTVFQARKAAAIPALDDRKSRRPTPGPAGVRSRRLLEQRGDACLLRRLRHRDVFLVRDDPRGERREPIGLRVQPPLPNPSTFAHLVPPLGASGAGSPVM